MFIAVPIMAVGQVCLIYYVLFDYSLMGNEINI